MVLWGAHDGYGRVKAYDLADIPKLVVDQVENPMHSMDACSSCLARLVSEPQRDYVTQWRRWNLRSSNGVHHD